MTIPILFLSWNRRLFTQRSFPALQATTHDNLIWAWDNGSTDGSAKWLSTRAGCLIPAKKNEGMNAPLVEFVKAHKSSEYVCKVDCDTIVEPEWLNIIMEHMWRYDLWACAAWHWRPEGPAGTFWEWARDSFRREEDVFLADYTGGTAVVIRTDLFREYGLPYLDYPCNLGDLTLLFRRAARDGKKIGWSTRTFARLLDLQYDNGPTTPEYSDYDLELAAERDKGNAWWTATGGVEGVTAWIESQGGREYL